jgi:predicted nucleic acid-binding protein
MKLFLDANILFTAAYSEQGVYRTLFQLAEAGLCSLRSSAYAADEARRNLTVKAPVTVPVFERLLEQVTLAHEPSHATVTRMTKLPLVEKDAPIMAAAVEAKTDILVTGDHRDFGHLYGKNVEGVLVLNPVDTLTRILA